jgi:glycine hydroxymethyltransferase
MTQARNPSLADCSWMPDRSRALVRALAERTANEAVDFTRRRIDSLVAANRRIHDDECVNLNPAANVMNPAAEALLAAGLGSRPSLGYPGAKHQAGLEAIEEIEIIAAEHAAEAFRARCVDVRCLSGVTANLAVFLSVAAPGDTIIAPPPSIGGHASHLAHGAAGSFGLRVHPAPIEAGRYSVDLTRLREDAIRLRPKLIVIGGSLNLWPPPAREVRRIADECGALVLYDAAHVAALIVGGVWPQPLADGAHVVATSTYKSLGGPPGGLIITDDSELASRIDRVVYPGLTANFDVGRIAALAVTFLDLKTHGKSYADAMLLASRTLAEALDQQGIAVFGRDHGFTGSHQFALEGEPYGGAPIAVATLRRANLLASSIGLPFDRIGIRMGTPELVRRGMSPENMIELAELIGSALRGRNQESTAAEVSAFRRRFSGVAYAG